MERAPDLPQVADAWMAKARAQMRAGDAAGALETYRQLAEQKPDSPQAPKALWQFAIQQDPEPPVAAAAARYLDLARRYPAADEGWRAYQNAGVIYLRLGNYRAAADTWREMAGKAELPAFTRPVAYYWLGRALLAQGDRAAAEQAWQAEALAQAAASWEDPPVVVLEAAAGAGAQGAVPSGFLQSSPGMMVQFAVFGLITTATVFHLERWSGTLRRMLTMPVARASIIGGHLLALCSVSFVQLVILAVFGQVALAVPYARAPAASLVMIVALALFTGCLGLVIGAFARSEDQVLTFSLVAMFVLASLGGAWFPLEGTGPAFARLAHLTPMAWAMDGLQNVILRGQGLRSVLLPAGVLVGWAAAFYALAVVRLRRG